MNFYVPPDPHGVKKWGDMTPPPAPMGAPSMTQYIEYASIF